MTVDYSEFSLVTPLKTNMEPKNESLEDDFTFQVGDFQVLYNYMNFPGCMVPSLSICRNFTSDCWSWRASLGNINPRCLGCI